MRIAFVGLGEAAGALISGWGQEDRPGSIRAYDIKTETPETAGEIRGRANRLGVEAADRLEDALRDAQLVFSTVTADQAVAAAMAGAPHLAAGSAWCDLNSCAPASKRRAEVPIVAVGARYLDVAVMAPVFPKRNMVPCLASGPSAEALAPMLNALPMDIRVVGGEVGRASSIKMIRSVMVKGLEALTAECALAAVAAGVADEVLPSLEHSHPKLDVAARAAYNFERSLLHGERRAAEMEEVAVTLADLGLPNDMSAATVGWQRRIAATGLAQAQDWEGEDCRSTAATLLAILRDRTGPA